MLHAASHSQVPGLVIGAALTFLGALIVQAFVIPLVQTRTRRRQRWEDNLSELQSLLEDEFPRAVSRLRTAVERDRIYRGLKDDPQYDQRRVTAELDQAQAAHGEAQDLVTQHVARMNSLINRLRHVHSTSPYWLKVEHRFLGLRSALFRIPSAWSNRKIDEERLGREWLMIQTFRKVLTDLIEPLAREMKPPRAQFVRHYLRKMWRWNRRIA